MKRYKKIIGITLSVTLGIILLLPVLLYFIVATFLLTPEKLQVIANQTSKEFINGEFTTEKIDFTFFSTFPRFSLQAENGALISYSGLDSTTIADRNFTQKDSLISFRKIYCSVSPLQYLFDNRLVINDLQIIEPRIYAYTSAKQVNNWDIVESDTTDTVSSPLPKFEVNNVTVQNATLRYTDAKNNTAFVVNGIKCAFTGIRKNTDQALDLLLQSTNFTLDVPGFTFKNDLLTELTAFVEIDEKEKKGTLRNAHLLINRLELTANGFVQADLDSMAGNMDLSFTLGTPDFGEFAKLIPDSVYPFAENFDASGAMGFGLRAHGTFNDSVAPMFDAYAKIENGKLQPKKEIDGIDEIALDASLHIDPQHNDSCSFRLDRFFVKSNYINLTAQGNISHLFSYPYIYTKLKGFIDLMAFTKNFPSKRGIIIDGKVNYDLTGQFSAANLMAQDYAKIKLDGDVEFPRLQIESPLDTFSVYAEKGKLDFSSSKKDPNFIQGKRFFGGNFHFDSLHIDLGNELNANLKKPGIIYGMQLSKDTTVAQPLFIAVQMDGFNSITDKTTRIRIGKSLAYCAIMPVTESSKKHRITVSVKGDDMGFRSPEGWVQLKNGNIDMKLKPFERDTTRQRKKRNAVAMSDSTHTRQRVARDTSNMLLSPSTIRDLRKWTATGNIAFHNMKARSPYFPMIIRMDSSIIEFTDNEIRLKDARVHVGSSDLMLSGYLNQLRRALLRGGKFKGDLDISSNQINVNELLYGLDAGMKYAEMSAAKKRKQFQQELAESDESLAMQEDTITAVADSVVSNIELFTVPENVDLALHMDAKKIQYKDLLLNNTMGEIIIKDKTLQLTNLDINSNAGDATLSLLYKNLKDKQAFAGFDLKMKEIQVEELIKLIPSIDSMLPMLRSFEGVVTCDVAAAAKLDSASNLLFPTLNAACYLKGKNMVLLDGETFTEISKKLFFKNKKRNMIDSISVEIIARDNQVEIFPFLLEIDRYRVAVGGTQNLDMSFNYHISVLKSPLPFKIGVDVFGNIDNIKFRLKKPKYKNIFSASSKKQLDKERVNIRESIYKTLQKEIHIGTLFVSEDHLHKIDSLAVMDIEPDSVLEVDSIPQSFLDSIQGKIQEPQ
ncbi:MAG: AsmA-like C-terminal region-containing protein [Bacteroidales bacterium]|nr:AsmA-like C-terminal region-containing protein [Bacteroidales bacterium]